VAAEVIETDEKRRYRAYRSTGHRLTVRVRSDVAEALERDAKTSRRSQAAIVEAALVQRYQLGAA
jgi:predicted HicB family RNase H-like nuclease